MMRAFVLITGLLAASTAHAVVTDCTSAGDSTPCAGPCIAAGQCKGGVCKPSIVISDGTPCISGNPCTTGDFCTGGLCAPGSTTVVCPSMGPCMAGMCDPTAGCKLVDICPPDMTVVPPDMTVSPDMTMPSDMTLPPPDLSRPTDDFSAPQPDFASFDLSSDDLAVTSPDGGADDLGASAGGQVRGSSLGGGCDCQVAPRAPAPKGELSLLLLAGALALWRRKAR